MRSKVDLWRNTHPVDRIRAIISLLLWAKILSKKMSVAMVLRGVDFIELLSLWLDRSAI